ncbi:hypothetical protein D1007_45592 [Hordeum vulgare]|nr:hypothetical protein D1007_45592 [Hordeum vulgare]
MFHYIAAKPSALRSKSGNLVVLRTAGLCKLLLPEVPPAGEEPPPPNGNPHPQFGRELTAEQLYQQEVHNWLVQNAAQPQGAPPAHEAPQQQDQHNGWGVWPASPPQAPQLPPYLYNFQAWLAAQGLQVQDGLVPEDNISDSASQAWNDAISNSNSSASTNLSTGSLNPLVIHSQTHQQQHSEGLLRISLEVHNSGIRFGLSEHGE